MIELIAFLGNPGNQYARNRHNASWLFAEKLPFAGYLTLQKKNKGRYAAVDRARLLPLLKTDENTPISNDDTTDRGENTAELPPRIHCIFPETYMNLSGESVRAAASFFKIPPERILVIHDELEMPLGVAGFKFGGGLGGHTGLRSMKASFGTADFWRLRIGIGRPDDREPGKGGNPDRHGDIVGWVLSDFEAPDLPVLDQVFTAASAALVSALLRGPESLLPEWNKKRVVQ
jgi:PTH1 family peptidyl-tRNA hydrolase